MYTSCLFPLHLPGMFLASIKPHGSGGVVLDDPCQPGTYWLEGPAQGDLLWLGHRLLLAFWTSCLNSILVFPSDNEPNVQFWGDMSPCLEHYLWRKESQPETINSSKLSKEYLGSRLQHIRDNSIFTEAIFINHLLTTLPAEAIK